MKDRTGKVNILEYIDVNWCEGPCVLGKERHYSDGRVEYFPNREPERIVEGKKVKKIILNVSQT